MTLPDLSALNTSTIVVFFCLALMSFVAITVSFYKAFQFARLGVGRVNGAEDILEDWLGGRPEEAVRSAADRRSVLARVLQAVFSGLRARPDDQTFAEELGRQTAIVELAAMTSRMRVLETIVQAAPMLGLLGTVIGMIEAFSTLSTADGVVDPSQLAGGIWTALTTTAAGLAIALVTFFIATWLEGRIESERQSIEALISSAINGRVDTSAGRH
jgi:biopolymer transport protein ExbB